MANEIFHFNGVNGVTGDYGLPPMSDQQLADVVTGEADEALLRELAWRAGQKDAMRHLGVGDDVDGNQLDQAGWGVIFTHDAKPEIREALSPLLEWRRQQAGDLYKSYDGPNGFRVGQDSKMKFLRRQGVGPGPVVPSKVPYYLLIVGSPEAVPYRFQTQLDVQYAVGRIDFGDDVEAYHRYAESVVRAESEASSLERRVAFFGTSNDDDEATGQTSQHLIAPLVEYVGQHKSGWQVSSHLGAGACKADLAGLFDGEDAPALLFTACHGMEFPAGDPRQLPHQGALLCQDWPGPKVWSGQGAIPQDHYFAGDDLASGTDLTGRVAFFFACYGCGTPQLDDFAKQAFKDHRAQIAPQAFLADLPTRMLGNAGGGALAVIGHVERAWGCSFIWPGAGSQTAVFESTLGRLLSGSTVGLALEFFNERYAELSTNLSDDLEEMEFGKTPNPYELANLWTANNDARGYVILGDPAVRLSPNESPIQSST